ncbi:MAG: tRNA dihydrouridine synthase DusB [Candidatus Omnitrophota bacterium]
MKIGKISIHQPLALAPMEDITDTPFRLICKRLGADLLFTEFTSSEALIRDARKAFDKILVTDEERPIGIQIYGGRESVMEEAAKIAESAHPDFIDINCGCWVRNHAMRGEGAGLLRDLPKLERIVKSTVKSTKLPVTVKTRLGWDQENIVILDIVKIVEQAGVKALTVHCRTRQQGFKGISDWSWLEKIKKRISIPLVGNGDIKTAQDVRQMFSIGCDGVMIGRGAVANPWIFQQAKEFLKTGKILSEPTFEEKVKMCIAHLELSVRFKGQRSGIVDFRKHYSGYLKGLPHIAKLRADLVQMNKTKDIIDRLTQFLDQTSLVSS